MQFSSTHTIIARHHHKQPCGGIVPAQGVFSAAVRAGPWCLLGPRKRDPWARLYRPRRAWQSPGPGV